MKKQMNHVLSREFLNSGEYLASFTDLPGDLVWPLADIENSLDETLQKRPGIGDAWVFGYGSLMWNPLMKFAAQRPAVLKGWHRSFCLRLVAGRGSLQIPGRMLSLEPGGQAQGLAFRLDRADLRSELRLVWTREMVTGAYRPLWAPVVLDDGTQVEAIVFVADPAHVHYEADAGIDAIAPLIARAGGSLGTNEDYVSLLAATLAEHHLGDEYIGQLLARLNSDRGTAEAATHPDCLFFGQL